MATTTGDGAGIAALRIHQALLAAGCESDMLVAHATAAGNRVLALSRAGPRWIERIGRRLGLALSPAMARAMAREHLASAGGAQPELFSLPDADYRPENDQHLQAAGILHLHWTAGMVSPPRFFSRVRQPVVWTLHDQHPYLGGFHYAWDRDRHPGYAALDAKCLAIKRAALLKCRALTILGNSRWNTDAARESGVFPESTRFETVYYPLETGLYAPASKSAARIRLGLDEDRLLVGFACTGLQNERKGFATLLAALLRYQHMPGARPIALLSFGRSPDESTRTSLRFPWRHLGFITSDHAKAEAYSAMDCFVIPSHAEAFGQTAIEALACETPVIGASVGGIPETIPLEHHERCLFPPDDPAALARVIADLFELPAGARAMLGREGRKHVVDQHSPTSVAAALKTIYASSFDAWAESGRHAASR